MHTLEVHSLLLPRANPMVAQNLIDFLSPHLLPPRRARPQQVLPGSILYCSVRSLSTHHSSAFSPADPDRRERERKKYGGGTKIAPVPLPHNPPLNRDRTEGGPRTQPVRPPRPATKREPSDSRTPRIPPSLPIQIHGKVFCLFSPPPVSPRVPPSSPAKGSKQ